MQGTDKAPMVQPYEFNHPIAECGMSLPRNALLGLLILWTAYKNNQYLNPCPFTMPFHNGTKTDENHFA